MRARSAHLSGVGSVVGVERDFGNVGSFRGYFEYRVGLSDAVVELLEVDRLQVNALTSRPERPEDLLDGRLLKRLNRLDISSARVFAGKLQGERRSKSRGQSVEFEDFRNYVPGDDTRFIDWNIYARVEKLFIKIFLEEEDLALHVVIDASASMDAASGGRDGVMEGKPVSKRTLAAQLALAMGYVGLNQQNRVYASTFGLPGVSGVRRLGAVRGRHNIQRFADYLFKEAFPEDTVATPELVGAGGDFNTALTTIARERAGQGILVLLSDFLVPEGYEAGLNALAAAGGYDVYAVQVLTPEELNPRSVMKDHGGALVGDLRLTDVETRHAREVTVSPALLDAYEKRVKAYVEGLHSFCLSRRITHVPVTTDVAADDIVFNVLRRHGVLR